MIHESCRSAAVEMLREKAAQMDKDGLRVAGMIMNGAAIAVAAMPTIAASGWSKNDPATLGATIDELSSALLTASQRLGKAKEIISRLRRELDRSCDIGGLMLDEAAEAIEQADAFLSHD